MHSSDLNSKQSKCSCEDCDTARCLLTKNTDLCSCQTCEKGENIESNKFENENKLGSLDPQHISNLAKKFKLDKEIIESIILNKMDYEKVFTVLNKTNKFSKPTEELTDKHKSFRKETHYYREYDVGQATSSAAKLSAQVMDVPYVQFEKSITNSKTNVIQKRKPSHFDLFQRLKEVYKACTCKFCECVVGKPFQNEICNCKPCDCIDCNKMKNSPNTDDKNQPGPGCPCVRCSRTSCKGLNPKKGRKTECDCDPNKKSRKTSSLCDCKPCECDNCKNIPTKLRTVVVAPVEENTQSPCECNQCYCAECAHRIVTRRNQTHEMSTSVNRHQQCQCEICTNEACLPDENVDCWCARHSKVMSKPIQQTRQEYDIRRTKVSTKNRLNHDTLAMYATITNSYLPKKYNKTCKCMPCECIMCVENEKVDNSSRELKRTNHVSSCKCSLCECQACEGLDRNFGGNNVRNNVGSTPEVPIKDIPDIKIEQYSELIRDGKKEELDTKPNKGFVKQINYSTTHISNTNNFNNKEYYKDDEDSHDYFICDSDHNNYIPRENRDIFHYAKNIKWLPFENSNNKKQLDTLEYSQFISKNGPKYMKHLIHDITDLNNKPLSDNNETNTITIRKDKSCNNTTDKHLTMTSNSTVETCLKNIMQVGLENSMRTPSEFKTSLDINKEHLNDAENELQCKISENTCKIRDDFEIVRDTPIYIDSNSNVSSQTSHINNKLLKLNTTQTDHKWNASEVTCNTKYSDTEPIKNESAISITDKVSNSKSHMQSIKHTDDDCLRVRNTIKRARIFSQQLIKLINTYENANKYFHKTYPKLSSYNVYEKNGNDECESKAKESLGGTEKDDTQFDVNSITSSLNDDFLTKDQTGTFVDENCENHNTSLHPDIKTFYKREKNKETPVIKSLFLRNITNTNKDLNTIAEENSNVIPKDSNSKKRKVKRNTKTYMYRKSIVISKKVKINPTFITNKKEASILTEIPNEIIKDTKDYLDKIDADISNKILENQVTTIEKDYNSNLTNISNDVFVKNNDLKTEDAFDVPIIDKSDENDILMFKTFDNNKVESPHKSICNKNLYLNDFQIPIERKNIMPKFNNLEMEVKEAIRSSLQPTKVVNTIHKTVIQENKALINLHTEVKKLLDMPILQPCKQQLNNMCTSEDAAHYELKKNTFSCFLENEINIQSKTDEYNFKKVKKFKHDFDSLKVNFLNVRKVSDHTVLMKWQTPENLRNVQGYELLIDGKAVQRILSPYKNMAVVTCLPQCDVLLLTVRTVTHTACPPGKMAAATILYSPKKFKHSRCM